MVHVLCPLAHLVIIRAYLFGLYSHFHLLFLIKLTAKTAHFVAFD